MKQQEDQEKRFLALEGEGSIQEAIACKEEDQAQYHTDGYHSGGCVYSHIEPATGATT